MLKLILAGEVMLIFKQWSERYNFFNTQKINRLAQYLIPSFLLVFLGLFFFSSTGRDDTHITYWPAYTLSHFGKILNYNGDYIEQSSTLLQVLSLALLNAMSGISMVKLGLILSVLCGAASLFAIHRLSLKIHKQSGFYTALLTGSSVYFIYWSFSGMESTLVSLTSIWLVFSYATYLSQQKKNRLVYPIIGTFLFVIVRPEMPIVLACILAGTLGVVTLKQLGSTSDYKTFHQNLLSQVFILIGVSTTICVLVFTFRYCYFGSLFPQPVSAKHAGISLKMFKYGGIYFSMCLMRYKFITVMAILTVCGGGFAVWKLFTEKYINPYILLSLLFLATYTSFIFFSGGDWMEGGRFFVHMMPIAVMFISFGLRSILKSELILKWFCLILLIFQGVTFFNFAEADSTGMPFWRGVKYYKSFASEYGASDFSWFERTNRVHIRDIPTIYYLNNVIEHLLAYKNDEIHIMSMQMGMIPYYVVKKHFGQVHMVDMKGLADNIFTECSITATLPRGITGLTLGYQYYFAYRQDIEKDFGMTRPDVIFDLLENAHSLEEISKHGYMIVYIQEDIRHDNSKLFHGGFIYTKQFVAVRRELAAALPDFEKVRIDFP